MSVDAIQQVDADSISPKVRRWYARATAVALLGNFLLAVGKALAARMSGSSAIYADAVNSTSDVAYSVLLGIGLWLSLRPPDRNHPHGHRRIESLLSVIIGAAMAVAGIEAARAGIAAWRRGASPTAAPLAVGLLIGSMLAKTGMYLAVRRMGQKAGSTALLASARDNLTDIISSAVALLGLFVSQLVFAFDPLAALLVSAWILHNAWGVAREGMHQLLGGAASPQLHEEVVAAVRAVPGVLGTDRVIIEHSGPRVYVDIHIKMRDDAELTEVHRVSHAVRDALHALQEVDHAFVHVEPVSSIPDGVPRQAERSHPESHTSSEPEPRE